MRTAPRLTALHTWIALAIVMALAPIVAQPPAASADPSGKPPAPESDPTVSIEGALAPPVEATGAVIDDPACRSSALPANDDGSGEAVTLPFAVDLFGPNRRSVYVNNNGNVTFDAPLSAYTPTAIRDTGMNIIAPFWADVDTRGDESGLVQFGTTTFEGHRAFCVNWVGVGYFSARTDKRNSFQLLLVQREDTGAARNFDMVMNYSQVEWESGEASGGVDGLGGFAARVGYSNGGSLSFELSGSNSPGALLDSSPTGLVHRSLGSSTPGRLVIPVRGGVPSPPEDDQAGAPGLPVDPQAQSMGQGKVKVSWTEPADTGDSPITSYDIYRDGVLVGSVPAGGEAAGAREAGASRRTFLDRSIRTGRPVNYTIVAVNARGSSRASAVGIRVLGARPAYSRIPRNPLRALGTQNHRALRDAIWAPGTQDYFTPQGFTIVPAGRVWPTRTFLISGYANSDPQANNGRCKVYAVNEATGGVRGVYTLPSSPCRHAGGIEYTAGDRVWLADTNWLMLLNLRSMFSSGQAVRKAISLTGLNGSFVFDEPAGQPGCPGDGGCLWIGHYREGGDTTLYRYSESMLLAPQRIALNGSTNPSRHFDAPHGGQGGDWLGGAILLSTSTSTCGSLFKISAGNGAVFWQTGFSPGSEEIALDGAGVLWNVSEAGARRFYDRRPTFFPLIARWSIGSMNGGSTCPR